MHGFEDADTGQEHIALVLGDVAKCAMRCCAAYIRSASRGTACLVCGAIVGHNSSSRCAPFLKMAPA